MWATERLLGQMRAETSASSLSACPTIREILLKIIVASLIVANPIVLASDWCLAEGKTPALKAADADRARQLARRVTIYRDTYGVPHIYSATDAGCVFGFVYAQAEDNFWQIEDNYLRALGRAAEVYGDNLLPITRDNAVSSDLLNRALEIPAYSIAEYKNASPRMKELFDAVALGLNYFLARNPQVKPRLLAHFEPWHVLALTRYLIYTRRCVC
jgi:acyl-homoserine lactone acylase PvdQ